MGNQDETITEDTPNSKLKKQNDELVQSQKENEDLRKQIRELQSSRKSKTGAVRSPKTKRKKRVMVIDSSDSDCTDSSSSTSSVVELSDGKSKVKRSKTVISRSTNNVETPTMKSGIKYSDWVHWVRVWQHSVKISRKEQAMLLLQALPLQTERFGNLQKLVADNLGIEANIKCKEGVENIIKELDKLFKEEEFPALITFMRKWETLAQKQGQIEVFFQEVKSLTRDAKDTFGLVIPPMMVAAKLMTGCTELSPEHFAAIAASVDFTVNSKGAKDADPNRNIDVRVEKEIRKFINNIGSLSAGVNKNKPKNVHLADVDCLGNKTVTENRKHTTAHALSDDDQSSSMDEEQIEVFINKLQRKKEDLRKKSGASKFKIPKFSSSSKSDSTSHRVPTSAEKEFYKKKRERKLRLMREGKCIQCESDQHVIADCADYKKIQAENKKRIEAKGGKWISWEERKAKQQANFRAKQVQLASKVSKVSRRDAIQSSNIQSRSLSRMNSESSTHNTEGDILKEYRSRSSSRSPSPRYSRFKTSDTQKLYSVKNGVVQNYLCSSLTGHTFDENDEKQVYKHSLMTQSRRHAYNINLVASSPDRAVADSGCEQAVSGVKWMMEYYDQLSNEDKDDVQILPSTSSFKFGPGPLILSQGTVIMPAYVAGFRKEIAFDIVPADVPLLLSLQNLKSLNLAIQYSNNGKDTAVHNGVMFELELSQGHHWISLSKLGSEKTVISKISHTEESTEYAESQIMSTLRSVDNDFATSLLTKSSVFSTDDENCLKELKKVHAIQGHMGRDRLEANLKRANEWNPRFKKLLDTLYSTCPNLTCRSTNHIKRGPVAAFPQANKLGDIVAADLKIRSDGKSILYLVDYATSFCLATFIDNKSCREITEKIIMLWYGIGLPRIGMLLTDNGSEFNGIQLNEFLSRFNTVKRNTSPYHPEMNGKCERIHGLVDLNMTKLLNDHSTTDINDNIALAFAIAAYNLSDMTSGYSPVQLVFGPQDSLTSVVNQSLSQAEPWDPNLRYAQLLKVRQEAVLNHLQIVTKSKFRNTILRKATPNAEPKSVGQWVYIKRNGHFEGPGQVCASLNNQCQVAMGSSYMNAAFSDLIPLTQDEIDSIPAISRRVDPLTDTIERIVSPTAPVTTTETDIINTRTIEHASTNDSVSNSMEPFESNTDTVISEIDLNDSLQNSFTQTDGNDTINSFMPTDATGKFTKGDMLQIRSNNGWRTIRIESKYRHKYAKNRAKYRFKYMGNPNSAVTFEDFNKIDWRQLPTDNQIKAPASDSTASNIYLSQTNIEHHCKVAAGEVHTVFATTVPYHLHNREDCIEAKKKELASIKSFNTFKEVDISTLSDDQKRHIIPCSWVIVEKGTQGNIKTKARLVARGDKEQHSEEIRSDSPTGSKLGLRLLLSICASKGWKCKSIDFKNAFLQGMPLDREVFMLPPKDYRMEHPNIVWLLIKPLYGLKDASRRWNIKIDIDFKSVKLIQSSLDQALYFIRDTSNKLIGMLLIHVDDCIFGGIEQFHKDVIKPITKKYEISSEDIGDFTFTGWNLRQTQDGISISQSDYLDSMDIDKFEVLKNPAGNKTDLLSHDLQIMFRRAVGTLGWLTHISKPHLAYYSAHFGTKVMKATTEDSKLMYRTLKKAKTDTAVINIANLGPTDQWKIISFSDSSWSRTKEFESIHGNITALFGSNSNCNILDWQAIKSDPPSSSPMAAEADGCVLALGKIQMLQYLLKEVLDVPKPQAILFNDSKSLNECVESTSVIKDKRMYINVAVLRSMMEKDCVKLNWIQGSLMAADALTKHTAPKEHLLTLMNTSKLPFIPNFQGD